MTTPYAMSFADFDAHYAGKRCEYVDGALLPRGPVVLADDGTLDVAPKPLVQTMLALRAGYLVSRHVLAHGLGIPLPLDSGFMMTTDPPEVRAADFAVLTPSRMGQVLRGEWLPFPPCFAVEIASDEDTPDYLPRKIAAYLRHGTRLLWVIRPATRTLDVHAPDAAPRTYAAADVIDEHALLPGLRPSAHALFDLNHAQD